jgi:hypothetical protein
MYPYSLKEDLGSGICRDALLASDNNHHLGKVINNHKTESFPLLMDVRPDMYSIDMDSHGMSRIGGGFYRPCFLVIGLAIAQAVQDLIYLPTYYIFCGQ